MVHTISSPSGWQLQLPLDPMFWPHALGYGVATFVPIPAFNGISRLLWQHIAFDAGVPPDETPYGYTGWLPGIVGALERPLYMASILAGAPEFIGVWLALKVAGGWKGYFEGQELPQKLKDGQPIILRGRALFNTSLIVIALSLIWALAGVAIIIWSLNGRWGLVVGAGGSLLTATYAFWLALWLWWRKKKKRASTTGAA